MVLCCQALGVYCVETPTRDTHPMSLVGKLVLGCRTTHVKLGKVALRFENNFKRTPQQVCLDQLAGRERGSADTFCGGMFSRVRAIFPHVRIGRTTPLNNLIDENPKKFIFSKKIRSINRRF